MASAIQPLSDTNTFTPSLYNMGINFRNIFGILANPAVALSSQNSKITRGSHRSASEPLPTSESMDILPRSQSECHLPLSEDHVSSFRPSAPLMQTVLVSDTAGYSNPDHLHSQIKPIKELAVTVIEEQAQPLCPPSPAATEIDDPESQDIVDQIQAKGIKVIDFAYPSATSSPSVPRLSPVPEIFDQYKGLAEVEYRWTQSHRTYPIQGKTLSRLIDMGWISQGELSTRAAPMDLEELRKHNARRPMYPWKAFPWTTIPTADERKIMSHARASYLLQWDKIRAEAEFQEMRRLRLENETKEVEEKMRERERQKALALSEAKGKGKEVETAGHKRRFEADDGDAESDKEDGSKSKKRKLSEEPENLYPSFFIPSKQYPAPLHSYDPEIYPEAAYAIGSSSQSQLRPVVPPRTDTPPLSDDEDTKGSPGRGTKLVHPKKGKALKRQLSRTQTYTQL